eukprot:1156408-Pelagomonas_calceolata.AAC.1
MESRTRQARKKRGWVPSLLLGVKWTWNGFTQACKCETSLHALYKVVFQKAPISRFLMLAHSELID